MTQSDLETTPEHTQQNKQKNTSIVNVNIVGGTVDRRANGLRYSYVLHKELMRYCRQRGESVCAIIEPLVYAWLLGTGHEFTYDMEHVHKYYTRNLNPVPMEVNVYRNTHHDRRKASPEYVKPNPVEVEEAEARRVQEERLHAERLLEEEQVKKRLQLVEGYVDQVTEIMGEVDDYKVDRNQVYDVMDGLMAPMDLYKEVNEYVQGYYLRRYKEKRIVEEVSS